MTNQEIVEQGKKYVMNTYGRLPLALVKGQGPRVWDADGKEYLDFVGGLAVNSLGHCHPAVSEAIAAQARQLIHCSNLYWIEPQVKLAQILVERSGLGQAFFCNSGAEANESAIKLARKYAKTNWGEEKYEIISMQKSFHGRTLATLTATGQEKFHNGFAPLPEGFKYVPFNDIGALEAAISPVTCAVLLEPVQGEGGVFTADSQYLKQVKELCEANQILLIFDEVQCGIGRTGKWFAFQQSGVMPDILSLAKALGGGTAIGAMLAGEKVASGFQPGDHASTFGGNPLACAAAVAAMTAMAEEKVVGNAAEIGDYFREKLSALIDRYDFVTEVRGSGLMLGLQLTKPGAAIVEYCLRAGLLINCVAGDTLRFLPPLNITTVEVDEAMSILERALEAGD
ncbi:acetylornithine transaminase [Metallumcola ferriviriculae]|uniref:Acetylornithine aminotransferase n=1 Tax=Metallumcola ferriviriculae TaxID=3039180 RepID=A0AAU0UGE5_9FIRM|nr:acetylornithine transaminase [Desulfitibacteraceae bacterium MK1]